ncbi:hypothetical protein MNBD_NITROSPINAE02-1548, partial [hydrothermal vent metagenome]
LEIVTWKYLGIHIKPIVILNYEGFFDHLFAQFEHCKKHAVMREGFEKLWTECTSIEEIFGLIDRSG